MGIKWHLIAAVPAVGISAPAAVLGDQAAVEKYRNFSPQQVAAMPEETRSSELPIMYSIAARRALSPGGDLVFGMELNKLMYPGIHDFPAAVREFQADLGDTPTGKLTVWQIHQLEQRAEMQGLSRVLFPDQFTSFIADDYASVQGTVEIVDERIAWPINHSNIKCFKATNQCEFSQIHLSVPDENSWSQRYHLMQHDTEYYSISRWGKDCIETHPLGGSNDCRNTSLSLNFKTKEFYFITRNAGGDCKVMGVEPLERLEKPRIAQIVDGSEIISEEFGKIQKKAFEALSSKFRDQVDALTAQEKDGNE